MKLSSFALQTRRISFGSAGILGAKIRRRRRFFAFDVVQCTIAYCTTRIMAYVCPATACRSLGHFGPLHPALATGFFKKDETMTVSISNIKASQSGAVLSGQVARAVAEARLAAGYSIDDLSLTTGLVHEEIVGVENGLNSDPAKLKRIAVALKLPPSALLVS